MRARWPHSCYDKPKIPRAIDRTWLGRRVSHLFGVINVRYMPVTHRQLHRSFKQCFRSLWKTWVSNGSRVAMWRTVANKQRREKSYRVLSSQKTGYYEDEVESLLSRFVTQQLPFIVADAKWINGGQRNINRRMNVPRILSPICPFFLVSSYRRR